MVLKVVIINIQEIFLVTHIFNQYKQIEEEKK